MLDVNDPGVNDSYAPEALRVPFRNFVYIGDSDTDIPCMKLVNANGGHSIGVYNCDSGDKTKVYKMMREGRIKYFAAADYREGAEMDRLVKAIIQKTRAGETLEEIYYQKKQENREANCSIDGQELARRDGIITLENSSNFANTHSVIQELSQFSRWTQEEIDRLVDIALLNSQVRYILQDGDVQAFYRSLLGSSTGQRPEEQELRSLLGEKPHPADRKMP